MKSRNLHYKEPKELKTLSLLRLEDFPFSHAINPGPKSRVSIFSFPSLCFSFLASSTTCSPEPRRLSFFPRHQSHPQITCSIFLVSFHAFLFPCLVHCFLSGAQKSFLFPRYQSCPKSHIPFFSFPSLRFSFFASSTAFSPAPRKLFFFHCFSPSCA